jgi:transcriptional regulator with XRE-family HTH domain
VTTEAPERSTTPLVRYIKGKRDDADLTQEELADGTGFTQPAISAWELGIRIPSARAVAALARALPAASVDEMLALIEAHS